MSPHSCAGCGAAFDSPGYTGRLGNARRTICPTCEAILTQLGIIKTHCPHGHAMTPDNVTVNATGWRQCKPCHRKRGNERYKERKETRQADK